MQDIAEFLRSHSPFDSLDEETLAGVAASAEIEFYAARAPILDSADARLEFAYVVRRGSVELVIDGRLLDLTGEGEMFGFTSLLSEEPLGFVARAAEDTLVYRIPADVIRPVLQHPAFVRWVAQSLNRRVRLLAGHETEPPPSAAGRPVGELIRAPALVCPPATSGDTPAQPVLAGRRLYRDRRRDDRARPGARRGDLVCRHPDRICSDHHVRVGSWSRASPRRIHERLRPHSPAAR
jgi:CBS domain-containing protein